MEAKKNATPAAKRDDPALEESFIQKWAIVLAGVVFLAAIGFYFAYFNGEIVRSNAKWGQFGDFLGGVVNPTVGFLTVWLLSKNLFQNQIALKQARDELSLATDAITQAREIQESTQKALDNQNTLAEHARDYANAIALFKHSNEVYTSFQTHDNHIKSGLNSHLTPQQIHDGLTFSKERMDSLAYMLGIEAERLAAKYPAPGQ